MNESGHPESRQSILPRVLGENAADARQDTPHETPCEPRQDAPHQHLPPALLSALRVGMAILVMSLPVWFGARLATSDNPLWVLAAFTVSLATAIGLLFGPRPPEMLLRFLRDLLRPGGDKDRAP